MLVLSRKIGEQVVVPDCQLTVTVLDVAGSRVRLGFSAPTGVAVLRGELTPWERNARAGETGQGLLSVRVLLVDPDAFTLATYRDYLSRRGAVVETASTGVECLERLREFAPEVLVLEPELPWGGGDGVLAILDEQPERRPPFVMLLSYARERGLLHRVSRFHVDDFQEKPLTATRLATRLVKLLGSQLAQVPLATGSA